VENHDRISLFCSQNSWTIKPGNEAWLYSDAASYYRAFVNACARAEKSIIIVGWDFHSDTVLTHRRRRGFRPKKILLGKFLLSLARRKPDLNIYVLTWDYAPFYILERERLQSFRRGWMRHPRIHFHMDDAHPISASQHQKFVVVDSSIAFIGGLDLTIRRWDENSHSHEAPLRVDPNGEPYGAFHDYQLGLTGPTVLDFISLFADRWRNARGQKPELIPTGQSFRISANPLPFETAMTYLNAQIAFSRTLPAFREQKELAEIAAAYLDLIRAAKETIIIENQYLTAHSVVTALSERLKEPEGPEVIIILPEKAGGWLEMKTMGVLQDLALRRIKEADAFDRLRIYYPFDKSRAAQKLPMTVHSKIILIDDTYFSIGSANLNNRSMGYDTECLVTIDASEDPFNQKAIRKTRAYVLAHHCEINPDELEARIADQGSVIKALGDLCDRKRTRHLAVFEIHDQGKLQLEDMDWLDMEKPSQLEISVDQWGSVSEIASRKLGISPRVLLLILTVVFAVILGFVWHAFLQHPRGPEAALRSILVEPLSDPSQAKIVIPLVFALGAIFFIPINLLIIITASLFSTGLALLEILLGIIANVAVGYALGRWAGRFLFERFFGKRTQSILNRIGQGQFLTILFIRIFPIAPSSLINLAAGSGKVPFFRFLSATLVGMMPGTLMLVLFQKSLIEIFDEPGLGSFLTLLLLGLVTFIIFRWSRRRFSRYRPS
jgi:phospholipase D1/2